MKQKSGSGFCKRFAIFPALLLSGCGGQMDLLDPKGSIGLAEKNLILTSTYAMLIVVVPVIFLTLLFAWKYRASNTSAEYLPKWAHSTKIEIVIWLVPALIILYLGILTYKSTHALDPYKPLESEVKPINVEVVALDWKWLFIYPDLGIATVNQIQFPVGTPVSFKITSDSVMNSFFIPQLGGQIYAMAGMQTKLHLIADHAGDYAGLSANFSGHGFSDMKFRAIATTPEEFAAWVKKVKASPSQLDGVNYAAVAAPTEKQPVQYFSKVDANLFQNIVAKYNNGHARNIPDPICRTKG
ncbi:MAG: ubiquinol oxidase subunit II [Pseudomonadota bacterium]|jgi:cytochrome o ubiquinol oxidase subunit 2|uniref:ubiquinol oxidase subunit II n=1 Tax=Burkholderia sp. PAMC 28687 TaxID=1795874 RepID=UPI00078045C9|nr:ubiquinol oxidase subunit II [Burkholderia sp. PAMC 28687]AMM12843.1 cytochrome ubiquinol oxidase subunit II [Burkholderia sp. PAMC 28687]MDP9156532.1 ubiquinol oxidase subunit II [Pseudomonadota bacterium]